NKLPKFSEFADPTVFESKQFGPNSADHIFLLHYEELDWLSQKAGLKLIEKKIFTNLFTNGHLKSWKILPKLKKEWIFSLERFTQNLPTTLSLKIHTGIGVLMKKE
ncbi:MAG: hypothetical protein ACOCXH_11585, partial [Cyclobacteriaceae bacterium]